MNVPKIIKTQIKEAKKIKKLPNFEFYFLDLLSIKIDL